MGKESFTRGERLRKRKEYASAYRAGVRVASKHFVTIVFNNHSGSRRLGVSVGRKIGNAVTRNRIKRLIREFYRLNKDELPHSHDIVVMAIDDASSLKCREVCQELLESFRVKFSR